MKKRNIYKSPTGKLEVHVDDRGIIADVFYGESINHVNVIESIPNVIRGNHFHKLTEQHILIIEGELEYWFWDRDSMQKPDYVVASVGDIVTSPPGEIHALRIGAAGCRFVTFSMGPRGGSDYESDTYRTENIIGPAQAD
jgi:dTDP-4-dehydrorhamnose 3,5-epimerase-like enzyme